VPLPIISASESTAGSPRSRSTVRIVTSPTPENRVGGRTARHWTSGRVVVRLERRSLSTADGSQVWRPEEAIASRLVFGETPSICEMRGVEAITTRAVAPTWRAVR